MMPRRRRAILFGAIIGLAATAPLAALMYLGWQLAALPMAAFDLFEGLTQIKQLGGLVTKAIDIMVIAFSGLPGISTDTAAKSFEQLSAVALFLVLGAIAGAVFAANTPHAGRNDGLKLGLAAWILTLLMELVAAPGALDRFVIMAIWFGVLYLCWGFAIAWVTERWHESAAVQPLSEAPGTVSRRKFLYEFGGAVVALTVGAWGIGRLLGQRGGSSAAGKPLTIPSMGTAEPTNVPSTVVASNAFVPAPGTRPEVTANQDFYRVDINLEPPSIDEKTWTLTVDGLVNKPLKLSYADIRKMPPIEQDATLECISNPVGGDLISSTHWTGVKLSDVLKQAGLKDGVAEIRFTCADDYMESLPVESAMDERTLLTYAMNGEALAEEHGFPLRLYTPNRFGMKNPKWITRIEAIDKPYDGYWEQRGWDKDAIVKATSVIDNVAADKAKDGVVPVGGIAFAGARSISKVEVAVDGGPWQEATLKQPISPLTWLLWRFDWKASKGSHQLRVRATDGQGTPQIAEEVSLHPSGASGYHSVNTNIT